jgi:hypothetical protein
MSHHNIRYAGFAANHSDALCLLFHHNAANTPSLIAKGYTSEIKLDAARKKAERQLSKFLTSGVESTRILSGENASSLLRGGVEHLADFFDGYGAMISRVICYVREPVSFANSLAQQRLKANATFASLRRSPPLPRFRKKLEPWLEVFGRDRVEIRVFEEAVRSKNGLIEDFLRTVGANTKSLGFRIDDVSRNESLCMEAATIVDAVNQVRPYITNGKLSPGRTRLDVIRLFGGIPGSRFSMGSEFAEIVREKSRADVLWLETVMGRTGVFSEKEINDASMEWSEETCRQIGLKLFDLFSENQSQKTDSKLLTAVRSGPGSNSHRSAFGLFEKLIRDIRSNPSRR